MADPPTTVFSQNKVRTVKKKPKESFDLEQSYGCLGGVSEADMVSDVQRVDIDGLLEGCSQSVPGFGEAIDANAVAAKTDAFLANPEEESIAEFSEDFNIDEIDPFGDDLGLPGLDVNADLGFEIGALDLGDCLI